MKLNDKDYLTFYRCTTCEKLVGKNNIDLCAGHRMKHAQKVSILEWLLIKVGVKK